jgi:hypothetical protein
MERCWAVCSEISGQLGYTFERLPWPRLREGVALAGKLTKRAELYALERGCTDAFLDTFSFQARPFYEKLGYRVFGTLENHPAGYQHYFMTKQLQV